MIPNAEVQFASNSVINALKEAEFLAYLTGDRFFGGSTEESRWEFYTPYTEETLEHLLNAAVKVELSNGYGADTTLHYVLKCDNVTVFLIHEERMEVKRVAQNYLKLYFPQGLPGNDASKQALWEMTVALVDKAAGV